MKLIAHRGNTRGPDPINENSPSHIDAAIAAGFDVEVDLWVDEAANLWLGHDEPQHPVSSEWLATRNTYVWVHCKNIAAFSFALKWEFRCFVHTVEEYVFTSTGEVWCYPGNPAVATTWCVDVLPETTLAIEDFCFDRFAPFAGVCSDYVEEIKTCLDL